MSLALMLALQTAAQPPLPIDFDLARVTPAESRLGRLPGTCRAGAGEEIVVCGTRPRGAYPYAEMERLFRARPIRAEMAIGTMTGRAFVEQVELDRGAVSRRLMFGISLPF